MLDDQSEQKVKKVDKDLQGTFLPRIVPMELFPLIDPILSSIVLGW
jgi:hypothetical protein